MLIRSLFGGGLPSLIIFDLDGTLVDSVPDIAASVDEALTSVGLHKAGEHNVRRWVGNGVNALIERAVADQMASDQFTEVLSQFQLAYSQSYSKRTYVYSGVISFLEKCRSESIFLSLITNKPNRYTLPLLRALDLEKYFWNVLSGDSLEEKKPHPMPLEYQLDLLKIRPDEALMIGDSVTDAQAAKAAAVPFLGVSYGYNHGVSLADDYPVVVDSLNDIVF